MRNPLLLTAILGLLAAVAVAKPLELLERHASPVLGYDKPSTDHVNAFINQFMAASEVGDGPVVSPVKTESFGDQDDSAAAATEEKTVVNYHDDDEPEEVEVKSSYGGSSWRGDRYSSSHGDGYDDHHDDHHGGYYEEDDDEDESYFRAAADCRFAVFPYATNPKECSEVKLKDYTPNFLYDNPHKKEAEGYCFWDFHLAKIDHGAACMCPRPKKECKERKKECYWHTYPNIGEVHGDKKDKKGGYYDKDDKKDSGVCIHNSERFYNLMAKLLAKRGKKDLSLQIHYSSAPARGKLPYGPHGPAIIGFGDDFQQRHKQHGERYIPEFFRDDEHDRHGRYSDDHHESYGFQHFVPDLYHPVSYANQHLPYAAGYGGYQVPAYSGSYGGYQTPAHPVDYQTPAHPAGYQTPAHPVGYETPAHPVDYQTPAHPVGYPAPAYPVGYQPQPEHDEYGFQPEPHDYQPPLHYNAHQVYESEWPALSYDFPDVLGGDYPPQVELGSPYPEPSPYGSPYHEPSPYDPMPWMFPMHMPYQMQHMPYQMSMPHYQMHQCPAPAKHEQGYNSKPAHDTPAATTYQQPGYHQQPYKQPAAQQPSYHQAAYKQPAPQPSAYKQPAPQPSAYKQPAAAEQQHYKAAPAPAPAPAYKQPSSSPSVPQQSSYAAPVHKQQHQVHHSHVPQPVHAASPGAGISSHPYSNH